MPVEQGPRAAERTDERFHGFVAVQGRGLVALPARLRRKYHLDRPGAQVEITERPDGVLEIRAMAAVPAEEGWFWDRRWLPGERAVDDHVARGEVTTFADADAFLTHLDNLSAADDNGGENPAPR